MPDRVFLKVEDLAARWGCSEGKVRRMIREGQLAALRLCGAYRIPEESIMAYEAENMTAVQVQERKSLDALKEREAPRPVVRAIV